MMKRWRLAGVVVVVASVALVAVGCSSKKKGGELDGEGKAGAGLSDETLGGSGGSLALAQQGLRGAGDSGPMRDIFFDYDSFELDETARQTLQESAAWLKNHPDARVEVEGHCDDRGTVEYNLALGAKRAAAAKNYLVALGIGRERMTTISYGEELPICQEETEECWSRNRRAHFVPTGS
jgi:peptidoglycan-associated lipoprotein